MLSVAALMLVLLMAGMGGASAETYVGAGPATFEGGFDWNETGSPYIINKTIYVEADETLTIGPGVTVLADPGCEIVVNGTLQVQGSATHPVVFDANVTSSFWPGISLEEGSVASIDHAVFRNASATIEAYDCDVTITNSKFFSTGGLAPVYADFNKGGSIVVSNCYLEADSIYEEEGAITIYGSAEAIDDETVVTKVSIIITDNVINSTSEYCSIYIGWNAEAEDDASSSLLGDILISGNTFNEDSPYSDTIYFTAVANAIVNATASINGNVTVTDNGIYGSGPTSILIERSVTAADNATASVVGDLLISDNLLFKDMVDTDFIDIPTYFVAHGDSTATISGNISVLGNQMFGGVLSETHEGRGLSILTQMNAYGENSTAWLAGDVVVADNTIGALFALRGFEMTHSVSANGYGKASIVGDVNFDGNTVTKAGLAFMYQCSINARDNSVVDIMGDVHMKDNVIVEAGRGIGATWSAYAFDNATVNVVSGIVVDGNQFGEIKTEFDSLPAMEISANLFVSQDAALSFKRDTIVHNNTVGFAGSGVACSILAIASDRASLVTNAMLVIEGNDLSCGGGAAIGVNRIALASGDAASDLYVEVVIKENDLETTEGSGIVISDNILADDAFVEFLGNVTIEGNSITKGVDPWESSGVLVMRIYFLNGNGTALVSSEVCVIGNELIGSMGAGVLLFDSMTASGRVENATLIRQGDIVIRDNNFGSCAQAVMYIGSISAEGHANLTYDAAVFIENNNVDEADLAFPLNLNLIATDFAALDVNMPVRIAGNVCVSADDWLISYVVTATMMDNSTLCLGVPMEITLNEGGSITVTRNAHARDNATIDAFMPICMAHNTVTGSIMVTHGLYAESGNSTVHATGDVTIRHNVVEYCSDAYSADVIDVNINVHARTAGSQQVCEAIYEADVAITENEVSASVENWLSVRAIDVNIDVMVTYDGSVDGPFGGSSARAAFGNVLVSKNVVTMDSGPNSYLYGICVDPDVHAYSWQGSQAHAGMGSLTVESNEVRLSTGYGLGIQYIGDYLCAHAEGEGSVSNVTLGTQAICGNLVEIQGNDGNGIVIKVYDETYAMNDGGARAEVFVASGLIASGNEVIMDGLRNRGMYLDVYLSSIADGGDACYEMPFALIDNDLEMKGIGNIAIYVVNFDGWTGYFDGDACLISELAIERNDMVMAPPLPPIAPGAPIDATSFGIRVDARDEIDPDSYNGTGSLSAGVCIADNTIEGAGYGIYLSGIVAPIVTNNVVTNSIIGLYYDECTEVVIRDDTFTGCKISVEMSSCSNVLIEGNAFLENEIGLRLSGGEDIIVRDNCFSLNGQRGLWADDVNGLFIEGCNFYMNDNGAYLDNVDGVVGNNTFYLNIGNGLSISGSKLALYNGEYDQNGGYGLRVVGGSVDWIVDARAVVHANGVLFAGEIVICGTLVLDYVNDFEMRPDNDVVNGIYAGHARLVVAEGGCLEAYNSVVGGEDSKLWYFDVYGGMRMFNCYMTDMSEVYLGKKSNVEMTTTTIDGAHGIGIRIDGCSPIIRGCTVTGSWMDGIYIVDGAKPTIVGCTIVGNDRGIYAYDACLDLVVDNIVMMNYEAGIYAERVTGTIHDNVLMFNGNELFLIDCDVVVENNQFGYGRLIEMNEPLASALLQAIDEILDINVEMRAGGLMAPSPFDIGLEYLIGELALMSMSSGVGIYAIDSCVEANGNEYGMLQTAVYLVRSDLVFSDAIRTNSFDMTYANGTRVLSMPFTVYDGIYAVDSTLTIRDAYFQVVDDAIFLENSCATIVGTEFDAGDFELYLFRDAEAAVNGELSKYALLDTSRLYWLATLTINVVDQDSFGIAGASVVVKDASGRVWSEGTTDRHGVFVAYAPYSLETKNGVNDTLGKTLVTTAYGDKASRSAEINVDGDDELTLKMTIKESSIFGTNPLVLGVVALVIVAVIVGAVMLARKK